MQIPARIRTMMICHTALWLVGIVAAPFLTAAAWLRRHPNANDGVQGIGLLLFLAATYLLLPNTAGMP